MHLDKIKLRESHTRLTDQVRTIGTGQIAAKALLWFAEYLVGRKSDDVFKLNVKLVASSTFDANIADKFLTQAAAEFRPQIAARAIEIAQAELNAAEGIKRR